MRLIYVLLVGMVMVVGVQCARRRGSKMYNDIAKKTPSQHHEIVAAMSANGQHMSIIQYLEKLMQHVDNLNFDDRLPSLYSFLGVAYHDASRSEDAVKAFQNCSRYHVRAPDPRCWMNEAEASMHIFRLTDAVRALEKAVAADYVPAYGKLLRAKGWTDDWKDFEKIANYISSTLYSCLNRAQDGIIPPCEIESGVEYLNPTHVLLRYSALMTPYVQPKEPVDPSVKAQLWTTSYSRSSSTRKRLKVGLVSSDFGVHPVATLIRGFVQMLDTTKFELYCFALTDKRSWWGKNISYTVEHFINLASTNTEDAAMEIAMERIDILFDLNGGTLNSGLNLMGHRPAPVQISYIGFPVSTGASYIDYYLADNVALPAEHRDQFVEKLALIPTTSIVNDYAQLRGALLDYDYDHRMPRDMLKSDVPLNGATFLFATLSNFQKICPNVFHTWMNILNRMPGSKMLLIAYEGSVEAIQNLRKYSAYFGKQGDSLAYGKQLPWIYHLKSKTALDMILDTRLKNGHTTGLDGLWAGVPTVTFGGMTEMGKRCGESFAEGLHLSTGLAFSLKEYEDIAIEYSRNPDMLRAWRNSLSRKRVTESLFDTKYHTRNLERIMESIWEIKHVSAQNGKTYNVVNLQPRGQHKPLETWQVDDDDPNTIHHRPPLIPGTSIKRGHGSNSASVARNTQSTPESKTKAYIPIPRDLLKRSPLMLNLGGYVTQAGWINVNIQSSSYGHADVAEVIRSINNLYGFPNEAVDAIYCSHSLEHLKIADLEDTLDEWARVLKPGGALFLSVPDLKVMARLLLDDSLDINERFFTMKMIYGAQTDEFDFHYMGFDDATLPTLLAVHGFCDLKRVGNFNLFSDTSSMKYHGYDISLNIFARKCGGDSGSHIVEDRSSPFVPA